MTVPPPPDRPNLTWVSLFLFVVPLIMSVVAATLFYAFYDVTLRSGTDIDITKTATLRFLKLAPSTILIGHAVLLGMALRPWQRCKHGLQTGQKASTLASADVKRALSIPRYAAAMALGVWWICALIWIPYGTYFGRGLTLNIRNGGLLGLCMGLIVATATFYVLDSFSARFVAPRLMADGNLRRLRPVRLVRAWHHILLLAVNLGVVGPLATHLLVKTSSHPERALLMLNLIMLGVAALQVTGVLRSIAGVTGHLARKMTAVRRGDLNVTAEVRSLDTFGQICGDFNEMVEGLRQRELIRETFGRYVTQQVADEILAGDVSLGGDLKTATVLFSDIRGFTTLSEHMAPEEVVAFLNRYFDAMVDCVFEHGGILDKFIGDAVMAVFGVPIGLGDAQADARAAVDCALAMSARLDALNACAPDGTPKIDIGIGLHTGELVAGNIGSQKRMEYTVIGDTVNLSSRLESLTKNMGHRILLTETTAAHCTSTHTCTEIDTLPVRGRTEPVRVYSVASRPASHE